MGSDQSAHDGHRPKTERRWLRLVAILADGPGDDLYLEDANDLGEWKSRLPFVREDRVVITLPTVPTMREWTGQFPVAGNEDILCGIESAMGL